MKKNTQKQTKSKNKASASSMRLALENRLLFDGAVVATAAQAMDGKAAQDQSAKESNPDVSPDVASDSVDRALIGEFNKADNYDLQHIAVAYDVAVGEKGAPTLLIVDSRAEGLEQLLKNPPIATEVRVLDPNRDGYQQIAEILEDRGISADLHIQSAIVDGKQWLGNNRVNGNLTSSHTDALIDWGDRLSADAKITFHGEHTLTGQSWLNHVQALTGGNVTWGQPNSYAIEKIALSDATTETHTNDDSNDEKTLAESKGSDKTVKSVVFIDTNVKNYKDLLDDIDPNATVILLNSEKDGVEQIADALNNYDHLDAIHIISHGSDGQLRLGTASLSMETMASKYADAMKSISKTLSSDADILIYGCNVAQTANGLAFVNRLANVTGADVTASVDQTGTQTKGGDWNLEYKSGKIEASAIISSDYQDVFAAGVATTVSSVSVISSPADAGNGYTTGEVIQVRVNFSGTEIVTGTPTIKLNVGGNIRTATYASGSGTNALVFSYTVVAGDVDASGIAVVANSLITDGGSINNGDTFAVAATLAHVAVADNIAQKVLATTDITPPVIRTAVGSGSTITLTYDEFGTGLNTTAPSSSVFSVERNGGVGAQLSVSSVSINHAAQTVTLTLSGLINSSDTNIRVSYTPDGTNNIQDGAGNEAAALSSVFVANERPSFDVKGNNLLFNDPISVFGSGTGKSNNDKILYRNVITVDGQSIDAIVTTTLLSNITIDGYDRFGSGNQPTPINVNYFELRTNIGAGGGDATFTFDFIKGGTYNSTTNNGEEVTLENVIVNSYDIDAFNSTTNSQYQEFGGFATYTVASDTTLAQTQQPGFTHFQDTTGANNNATSGAVFDRPRVQALYESIHSFSIKTGAVGSSTAFYYIEFGKGANFVNPQLSYEVPTVNTRITDDTTPDLSGTFVGTVTNSSDQAYSLSVEVDGTTYTATTRTVLANGDIQLTDAATGLTGVFNPTTGVGTWTLTIPGGDALALGTYDVEVDVGYGPNLAGVNSHTVDTTSNELVINTDPADVTKPTISSIERLNPTGQNIAPSSLTVQNYVDFNVTFSEAVSNIDDTDFQITGAGSTGSSITSVVQTGPTTYTVRVSGIPLSNLGVLDLNLLITNDLIDLSGNLLGGTVTDVTPTTGVDETYLITNAINVPPIVDLNGSEPESTTVGWEHNSPTDTPNAGRFDNGVVVSGLPEASGSGITLNRTGTLVEVSGANSADYSAAVVNNDYIQYTFTTAAGIDPATVISGLYNADWNDPSHPSGSYKVAVDISTDGFATSTSLVRDVQAATNGGGFYEPVIHDANDFSLGGNTTYAVRVYIYDNGGANVTFDDFQIFTQTANRNFETTFIENGAAVSIADTDSFVSDADDTNMESALIVLTNTQANDLLTVGALPAGISSTIDTSVPGQITVTLTGSASKADYATGIEAITFSNSSQTPSTVDRVVEVTVNDGTDDSNTAISTIHVLSVNDRPSGGDLTVNIQEDTSHIVTAADFLFADVDSPANNFLNVIIKGVPDPAEGIYTLNGVAITAADIDPVNGFVVSVADINAGLLIFTPASNVNGNELGDLSFIVQDDGGTDNGGFDTESSPNILNFNIAAVNDVVTIGGLTDGAVVGTDAQVEESDLSTGTTSLGNGETATGTFTLSPIGSLATFSINGGISITAAELAASGTTPITQTGTNGTLTINGYNSSTGAVSYSYTLTSPATHSATPVNDSFDIVVTDVDGDVNAPATLTINIVDDVPIADPDVASISEDGVNPITGDVFADDLIGADGASTVPAGPVTAVIAGAGVPSGNVGTPLDGSFGSITLNADGTYEYTLDDTNPTVNALQVGETLTETFTYQITDGDGDPVTTTLTITINGANDAPVAVDDTLTVDEDSTGNPSVASLLANDTDVDGPALAIDASSVGTFTTTAGGSITIAADGSYSYTPAAGYVGTDSFDYTVTDGTLADVGRLNITVNPVNDAPVAVDDTLTVDEDSTGNPSVASLLANDTDVDGPALAIDASSVGTFTTTAGGSITIAADGSSYSYTPAAGYVGTDSFDYTVTDGTLADVGRLNITVNGTADPAITVSAPDNTNDTTPTITGTTDLPEGSTVTITITDSVGNEQTLTAVVQVDGSYRVDVVTPLAEGTYTAEVTATDAVGNTATASDPGSVDTTPPVITVNAPDNTSDTTPVITGTTDLPSGSEITITVTDSAGNVQTLTTVVQPDGTYSVDVVTPLADGHYSATATGTDTAGNSTTVSDPGSVNVKRDEIGSLILLSNPTPPLFPATIGGAYSLLPFREPELDWNSSEQYHPSRLSLYGTILDYDLYLTGSLRNQVVLEMHNYSFSIPPGTFRHTNPNEQLEYDASKLDGSPLPSWLHFDPKQLRFSGVPPKGATTTEVMVIAKDRYGKKAFATFKVYVNKEKNDSDKNQNIKVKPVIKAQHAEVNRLSDQQPVMVSKLGFSEQLNNAGKLSRLLESRALLDSLNQL